MENQKLIRLLTSIGKACFIEFYYDFKNCANKQEIADKIFQANSNRRPDKNLTRIYCAQQIFNNHWEKEALNLIMQSSRLDEKTKKTAREILANEML